MIDQEKKPDTRSIETLIGKNDVLFLAANEYETIVMSRTGSQARAANEVEPGPECIPGLERNSEKG